MSTKNKLKTAFAVRKKKLKLYRVENSGYMALVHDFSKKSVKSNLSMKDATITRVRKTHARVLMDFNIQRQPINDIPGNE